MKPPQFAAENVAQLPQLVAPFFRFNEAAAICGGKRTVVRALGRLQLRFNEAAAICGGKPHNRRVI